MSIATTYVKATRRQGVVGHVCARHAWHQAADFAGQGNVVGIKREPQPTTYEGRGSR